MGAGARHEYLWRTPATPRRDGHPVVKADKNPTGITSAGHFVSATSQPLASWRARQHYQRFTPMISLTIDLQLSFEQCMQILVLLAMLFRS